MALAAKLTRGLGSDNVDFRLRQTDFRADGYGAGVPWLGMPIADLETRKRVLVIGSFLRKDHPLAAQRLRQAVKKGAELSMLHSVADDSRIPVAHSFVATPSLLPLALAEIVVAAAQAADKPVPDALAAVVPSPRPRRSPRASPPATTRRSCSATSPNSTPTLRNSRRSRGPRGHRGRDAGISHRSSEQRRRLSCRRAAAHGRT